jgi:hypothetical protein
MKIEPPTGPMRIELDSINESRVRYLGEIPERPARSGLRLIAKLTGERLPELVGLGRLIVEEMTDDTGATLVTAAQAAELDAGTRPYRMAKQVLARGFLNLQADAPLTSRSARKITKVRGRIDVVYGKDVEEIMIDNPLQYLGRQLEHPRLKELNMKIDMIQPGAEHDARRDGKGIALRFNDSRKRIRKVELYDAWLKPMYARERPMTTEDGGEYSFFGVMVGEVDADVQMLLRVYPSVEDERITFEFTDLELP